MDGKIKMELLKEVVNVVAGKLIGKIIRQNPGLYVVALLIVMEPQRLVPML